MKLYEKVSLLYFKFLILNNSHSDKNSIKVKFSKFGIFINVKIYFMNIYIFKIIKYINMHYIIIYINNF